ncbi:hypothetical protein MT325_m141R [Paramecium bursaria chlorella virus MT325]|uniref:Uncharacterized protein m141R n=2 Tax=Paramecium bursaria Chlorella virus A1 TaxID=381899 RepID=A7ITM1_PBCVM|nr:hypothetical protein FR483_n138R [Paramecium bursaria Chlorella virus FR483]ABT13695.1 hypothetical protein MT325_m141R [Paramecium bursaria chlorella virus MT325]ABT15423.1 hypothetical protein FR483_n138R [Paramecium bursaria Chlorella virus FR483]
MKLCGTFPRTNSSRKYGALASAVRHHQLPRTFGNPKMLAYSRNRSFSAPGWASYVISRMRLTGPCFFTHAAELGLSSI